MLQSDINFINEKVNECVTNSEVKNEVNARIFKSPSMTVTKALAIIEHRSECTLMNTHTSTTTTSVPDGLTSGLTDSILLPAKQFNIMHTLCFGNTQNVYTTSDEDRRFLAENSGATDAVGLPQIMQNLLKILYSGSATGTLDPGNYPPRTMENPIDPIGAPWSTAVNDGQSSLEGCLNIAHKILSTPSYAKNAFHNLCVEVTGDSRYAPPAAGTYQQEVEAADQGGLGNFYISSYIYEDLMQVCGANNNFV